jgi:hypothetical protein
MTRKFRKIFGPALNLSHGGEFASLDLVESMLKTDVQRSSVMQRSFLRRRRPVAMALATAVGVAAIVFAPSAQAAGTYNVMLTKIPAGVGSVKLWDYPLPSGDGRLAGCFKTQSGRDTNTGYKVAEKRYLTAYRRGDSTCSGSNQGQWHSPIVRSSNLTNFWFSLS